MIFGTIRMNMRNLLTLFIILSFGINSYCQSTDVLAQSHFLRAQEEYSEGNNASALQNLDKTVEYLGSTNPRIEGMYVKITFNQNDYATAKKHLNTYFDLAEENHPDYMEMLRFVADIENKLAEVAQKEQQNNQLQQLRSKANYFKYEDARRFNEGLAAVKINDKWGFINSLGKLTIPAIYEYNMMEFHGGFAVGIKNNEWGLINKAGKWTLAGAQRLHGDMEDGILAVEVDNKWGHYDFINGKIVTPIEYDYAYDFSDGLAFVTNYKKINGGYTNDGIKRIPRTVAKYYGVINTEGNFVIPLGFNPPIGKEVKDGIILLTNERKTEKESMYFPGQGRNKHALFNKDGQRLTDYKYYINNLYVNFSEGYLTTSLSKIVNNNYALYGIINTSGKEVIPFNYKKLGNVKYGMVWAKNTEGIGVLNINAKVIIPFGKYEAIKILLPEVIAVKKNGLWGLINLKEEVIAPIVFDDIKSGISHKTYAALDDEDESLVLVKKFDKWSFINLKGEYLGE